MEAIRNPEPAIWEGDTLNNVLKQLRLLRRKDGSKGIIVTRTPDTVIAVANDKVEVLRALKAPNNHWVVRYDGKLIEAKAAGG